MVTASGAVANVTAAADGAVADASATVEGAAAKFASFASTMSKVALTTAGDAADAVGLDKKCTAAAMDLLPEHTRGSPASSTRPRRRAPRRSPPSLR